MTGREIAADEAAFDALLAPHRRELLVHCYRILGSLGDAEDALQDALIKAWRGLPSFQGRSSLRRWLYTIATRASLDLLAHRKARTLPLYAVEPSDGHGPVPPPSDIPWLEPLPDELLADEAPGPEARVGTRESVALAFLVALQALPPNQRAALILRDVAGYSAAETAEILSLTVPAANSALQRARETVAARNAAPSDDADPALLARIVAAFETRDPDALIGLLTSDAAFSMPPWPLWLLGHDAIRAFLRGVLFAIPEMRDQRLRPIRANGSPAIASWARGPDGDWRPAAIEVLVVRDGKIAEIHAFLGADFARFGLGPTP